MSFIKNKLKHSGFIQLFGIIGFNIVFQIISSFIIPQSLPILTISLWLFSAGIFFFVDMENKYLNSFLIFIFMPFLTFLIIHDFANLIFYDFFHFFPFGVMIFALIKRKPTNFYLMETFNAIGFIWVEGVMFFGVDYFNYIFDFTPRFPFFISFSLIAAIFSINALIILIAHLYSSSKKQFLTKEKLIMK